MRESGAALFTISMECLNWFSRIHNIMLISVFSRVTLLSRNHQSFHSAKCFINHQNDTSHQEPIGLLVPSTNRDMTLKTSPPRKCLGNKKTCFKLLGKDFFTYRRADRLPCRKLNINYEMISIAGFKPLICKKNIKIHFLPHWMASYTLGSFSH